MTAKRKRTNWKSFHKWAGLVLTVFLLLFCVSGIILNHREFFAPYSVSRSLLPSAYHIENYNNGLIKGTIVTTEGKLLAYGNSGVWLTDSAFSRFTDFNAGLPAGADFRNIRNIAEGPDGTLWCAAQFGLYHYENGKWQEAELPGNRERLADVAIDSSDGTVVALTRSNAYLGGKDGFKRQNLASPTGFSHKVTLFKTVWQLHSGELFGTAGRIAVDLTALVIIFLCVTGVILFILPYSIRRSARERIQAKARRMKWNLKWHNRTGYWTIVLTLVIATTGMCLRPPLMIPLALTRTAPIPGTALDNPNPWHDRLRAIREDSFGNCWLLSTSEGFYRVAKDFEGEPEKIEHAPAVSPMGVNVLRQEPDGTWLVGSFSGIYRWDLTNGLVTDYYTGRPVEGKHRGRPVSDHLVAGFSGDLACGPAVFDYSEGAPALGPTPPALSRQPMSLWNFALELHVGRCYSPFLGPLSELFVLISGLLLTLVLVSGLIIHKRYTKSQTTQQ